MRSQAAWSKPPSLRADKILISTKMSPGKMYGFIIDSMKSARNVSKTDPVGSVSLYLHEVMLDQRYSDLLHDRIYSNASEKKAQKFDMQTFPHSDSDLYIKY